MNNQPYGLPERPLQPTYYVVNDSITGFGSVFLHMPDGRWMRGGVEVDADKVPSKSKLRPIGVEVTR